MSGQIEVITGEGPGKRFTIPLKKPLFIGRASDASVRIKDETISKLHCRIFEEKGQYILEDLQSRNGCFINGKRIQKYVLEDGDIVQVGKAEIYFSITDTPIPFEKPEPPAPEKTPPTEPYDQAEEELFIKIAISVRRIPFAKIEECRGIKKLNPKLKMEEILIQKGYISYKDLDTINKLLKNILNKDQTQKQEDTEKRHQDRLFVKVAMKKGYLNESQVKECGVLQKKYAQDGLKFNIHEIVYRKGYLSTSQVDEILKLQKEGEPRYQIDGYKIISLIGHGGMGAIYKAKQISMDRLVAIKIISEEFRGNKEANERFLREARSVARLNHENIITGIDFGEIDGLSYFIMEYVDGISVSDLLGEKRFLDPQEAIDIALQVARALDHAYERNLIHRDIKPENILINKSGIVKLCDLGLSKIVAPGESSQTQYIRPFGTPGYMSPEQIRCDPDIDIRTDIYSLGITFYRMVFGFLPFTGPSGAIIMTKHLTERIKFPVKDMSPIKRDISTIINKMVAKNKEERYQFPKELIKELLELAEKRFPEKKLGTGEIILSRSFFQTLDRKEKKSNDS